VPTVNRVFAADFGPAFSGLVGTCGYSLNGAPPVTAGVYETVPGSGVYAAAVPIDGGASGVITWDARGDGLDTATQEILPLWSLAAVAAAGGNPDFAAACNALVAIQVDANSNGAYRTRHKGVPRSFVPVPGLSAVPVVLGQGPAGSADLDGYPVQTLAWQAMFPSPVALDESHRLVLDDPDAPGTPRYLEVTGRSYNAFSRNHHWYVPLIEYVLPLKP
jgi:hypothetical protein